MDPNLFHLDPERTVEVLFAIVVLSFMVERSLAVVFEHRAYVDHLGGKGFKAPIAFVVSLGACVYWDFDAVSTVLLRETTTFWGHMLTAGIVAGGSKASLTLFDKLGVVSLSEKARRVDERSKAGKTNLEERAGSSEAPKVAPAGGGGE